MLPELLFFKDLDSFELTPEYLEVAYLKKNFRFYYPLRANKRKYSVQPTSQIQIMVPDMMMQVIDCLIARNLNEIKLVILRLGTRVTFGMMLSRLISLATLKKSQS